MKQVAVVTGSSSGFGLLTAIGLAKQGFHVIATMRNLAKQQHLQTAAQAAGISGRMEIVQLDVTCAASIRTFSQILQQSGRVDILVNNAGYALGGFAEEVPLAAYRAQFDTNVFGAIAVTQTVLPFMRRQQSGKIINMSSISGRVGFPGLSPYVASKHALEGWSECLRLELQPFGIDVILIEPGSYRTNIWTTGRQVAAPSSPESPYYHSMKKIEAHIAKGQSSFGDPQEVADTVVALALQERPSLRYPLGRGLRLLLGMKAILPWKWWERTVLRRLS